MKTIRHAHYLVSGDQVVHIHTADEQPLVRYHDPCGMKPRIVRVHPRAQVRCHNCARRRWAKNLRIQVYYDMLRVYCADGCVKRGKR